MSQHDAAGIAYADSNLFVEQSSMQYLGLAIVGAFMVIDVAVLAMLVSGLSQRMRIHH